MPTFEQTLRDITMTLANIESLQARRKEYEKQLLLDPDSARLREQQQKCMSDFRKETMQMRAALAEFQRLPDCHYSRRKNDLEKFLKDAEPMKSVFIMTKYPNGDSSEGGQLKHVIKCVRKGVVKRKYEPWLASDKGFDRWLWGNVEVFVLGCARGIAIVEDKYAAELNPNVAMEWGWMAALNRPVLYLREKDFSHDRADWKGLLSRPFDWNNPAEGIERALDEFLAPEPPQRGL